MNLGDEVKVIDPGQPYHEQWSQIVMSLPNDRVVIEYDSYRYEIPTSKILGRKQDMLEQCNCEQALNYKEIATKLAKNVLKYCEDEDQKKYGSVEYLASNVATLAHDIIKISKEEDEYARQEEEDSVRSPVSYARPDVSDAGRVQPGDDET